MTTSKKNTVSRVATVVPAPAAVAAAPAPHPAPAVPLPVIFVNSPPADANIPLPPAGFTNTNGYDYRGITPKRSELAVMPDVIAELKRFSDYTSLLGRTAPPLASVLQTFTAAGEWSAMRVKTTDWDLFSRTQEGIAWTDARIIIQLMRPAFDLAAAADASIARQYPALVRLFDAKRAIAHKAVTTRKAIAKDTAAGKPPTRGKLATLQKRAAKAAAALAAATKTHAPAPADVPPAATVVAPPPVVAASTPVAAPAPAAAPPNGAPVALNGGAHS